MAERLPALFLSEGLELARSTVVYGVLIEDMTKQELLAVAAKSWEAYRKLSAKEFEALKRKAREDRMLCRAK